MPAARTAREEDVRPAVQMLARAFLDDPIARHFFPDATRRPRLLERFFELQIRHSYLPRGEVLTYDDVASAALLMGPDGPPPSTRDRLASLQLLWLIGRRLPATHPLIQRIAQSRPKEPHCYVGTIGTEPGRQREGLASGLLVPFLERCDLAGLQCCLESSNEVNIGFYSRLGFVVHEEFPRRIAGPSGLVLAP